jgi:Replication initiator protein, pSAM2
MTEPATPVIAIRGPQARAALRQVTQDRGGCIRPVQLRRTNLDTGEVTQILIPCGATLEATCPACARRAQSLRADQCRDTPKLPRRPVSARTTGKVYTAQDGTRYRPSMFLTLTCDSYGRVRDDGTPADPASYDYQRAARDAIRFAALFDRLIQNLRRYLGYDAKYFAAIEPQKRLAPHVHVAFRGAISRADLRQVIAATYHQVWWPSTETVRYDSDRLPEWHEASGRYVDPGTGEFLLTWDQALDAIGPHDAPLHVARFGPKFDAKGVLAGTRDAKRCIGYLTKYLTKQLGRCHQAETSAQADHVARLVDVLRYEPCSPTCANWLRYGIAPKNPRAGLTPGMCKGKAHQAEHLGYAGRRVLTSRKWSGQTLDDHRAARKAWLTAMLDLPATDPGRYTWERVAPADPDAMAPTQRLLHVLADRTRWRNALAEARRRAEASGAISAMREAA